jgi:hypothetical protein
MSERVINKTHDLIVNNDMAIIDFLADMEDRSTIRTLSKYMAEQKDLRSCIVAYHAKEKLITVLVSNDPFEMNEPGNILMLFYAPSYKIDLVTRYFADWLTIIDYSEKDKRAAVREIVNMLIACKDKIVRQNTQTSFMG